MQQEYVRYGVPQVRPLVGGLQIAGALGLLAGLALPLIGQLAAAGLTLLMFFGVRLRIRIKDSLLQMLPAIFYFALGSKVEPPGQLEPRFECMRWVVPRRHVGFMSAKAPMNLVEE